MTANQVKAAVKRLNLSNLARMKRTCKLKTWIWKQQVGNVMKSLKSRCNQKLSLRCQHKRAKILSKARTKYLIWISRPQPLTRSQKERFHWFAKLNSVDRAGCCAMQIRKNRGKHVLRYSVHLIWQPRRTQLNSKYRGQWYLRARDQLTSLSSWCCSVITFCMHLYPFLCPSWYLNPSRMTKVDVMAKLHLQFMALMEVSLFSEQLLKHTFRWSWWSYSKMVSIRNPSHNATVLCFLHGFKVKLAVSILMLILVSQQLVWAAPNTISMSMKIRWKKQAPCTMFMIVVWSSSQFFHW